MLSFRYLISRVEGNNNANEVEEDDSSSVWTIEDEMYQRGHITNGQQNLPNLSIEQIANRLQLTGLNYEDIVALYVLPHKDNIADLALYDTAWISVNERAVRNILRGYQ